MVLAMATACSVVSAYLFVKPISNVTGIPNALFFL
jgi:hypothetical protein